MLNVLYQFNEKYAPFAGTSITSLFENHKSDITVYILGEELTERSREQFHELQEKYGHRIEIMDTSDVIAKMKEWGLPPYRGSYSANLRLFIPSFLNNGQERIIYLDSDTIVNADLTELYKTDLGENVIAMSLDSLGSHYKQTCLGFLAEEPYYNSGVILFDLNKWRAEDFSGKMIDHIRSREWNYSSPDQDLLNIICRGRIKTIGAKYNFQPVHEVFSDRAYAKCYGMDGYYATAEIAESRKDVRIYHSLRFAGDFPWDANTLHPYRDLFDRYLAKSPWNGYVKKPVRKNLVMKIEQILYRGLPRDWYLSLFVRFHNMYLKKQPEIAATKEA